MLDAIPLVLAQDEGAAPPTPPPDPGEAIEGADGAPLGPGNGGAGPAQPPPGGGLANYMPLLFLGLLLVLFLVMTSGQRRERKKREAMLSALKKGDKIQTVGGIIGTLVELRDDEVVVKVDENSNTRLRFARNAIQNVLREKEESA